jgi:phage-related tail fiber protein
MTTWKDAVRLATTGNVDLASPPTSIDGVTLATRDRILVKDQTMAAQNGIYVSAAGSLTRSSDTMEFEDAVRLGRDDQRYAPPSILVWTDILPLTDQFPPEYLDPTPS